MKALFALILAASYSLALLVYARHQEPAHYAGQFGAFVLVALGLQLAANHLFGLYGRMWRHAGIEEARQMVLSSGATLLILLALYPIGRVTKVVSLPLGVVLVGAVFSGMAMGALRFHSRLFAWQRGSRRLGLRVAVIERGGDKKELALRLGHAGVQRTAERSSDGRSAAPRTRRRSVCPNDTGRGALSHALGHGSVAHKSC